MKAWDAALPKTRGGVMTIDMLIAARERASMRSSSPARRDFVAAEFHARTAGDPDAAGGRHIR